MNKNSRLNLGGVYCPCGDCPEKGCGIKHSTCEKYLDFKERMKEYNKAKRQGVVNHSDDMKALYGQKRYTNCETKGWTV